MKRISISTILKTTLLILGILGNELLNAQPFTELTTVTLQGTNDNRFTWADYDNDGDLDVLIPSQISADRFCSKMYRNDGNNTFTYQTAIKLPSVYSGAVAWADYNNDGYLDFILTGEDVTYISKLYKNNGDNTFSEQTGISIAGVSQSSVDWGDYDNDGDLDILLCGQPAMNLYTTKIYRNNGDNSFTEQKSISLQAIRSGSVKWGDYDNDGYLDILLTGWANITQGSFSGIYRNNGDNTFTEQKAIQLTYLGKSSAAWGDYDNDGDLDILITGESNKMYYSKIYRNNGNNSFAEQKEIVLTGLFCGTSAWGDYDNDGDLDILLTGSNINDEYVSLIYRNNGDNSFSEQSNISLKGIFCGSAVWGDYDNDGDLDIILSGETSSGRATKIYRNDIITHNTPPEAPVDLSATLGRKVVLKWNAVKTDNTPSKGITYNLKIGKSAGAFDVAAPQSANSGLRRLASMGNAQLDTSFVLTNLKKGTYYWSVQAVDNSFEGGPFSIEHSFTYNIDIPDSALTFSVVSATAVKCSWKRGNGDKCVVFASEKGTGDAPVVNNTNYIGNKSFGDGTQIGTSGWFCVYNGDLDTATIINLKPNTEYRFHAIEYTGNANSETYYTSKGQNNPNQFYPVFSEQTQISLTGIAGNMKDWGDYDNDGDLDLLVADDISVSPNTYLYKNNGDNTFSLTSVAFNMNSVYDLAWGDYNNDGYLDLIIAGSPNSKIFQNNRDGSFTEKILLPEVSLGKCAWADLDNDGFKDILLTGTNGAQIFKNNRGESFSIQTTTIPTLSDNGMFACGDYDNDGDLDILASGNNGTTYINKLFRNGGNWLFSEQIGIVLSAGSPSNSAWMDINNDGFLDIIICSRGTDIYTKIYNNNGNNSFSAITASPLKAFHNSALEIGDYNNDGFQDIIISGTESGSDYYTVIYSNTGQKNFKEVTNISLPGISSGSIAMADYDNDGDLDLFLSGKSSSGKIAKIFKNNQAQPNMKPAAPTGLSAQLNGKNAILKWNAPANNSTNSKGLNYSIYVYETSKNDYIKAPDALPFNHASNGRRLLANAGDIQYVSSGYPIKDLAIGTYKWSVQAVDADLQGSEFAIEGTFSIIDLSEVTYSVKASNLVNTTDGMQYSLSSTNGNDGAWYSCTNSTTSINFGKGGYDIWVRQNRNTANNRKIGTIKAQKSAPSYAVDFINETTDTIIPATDEFSKNSDMSNAESGTDTKLTLTPGQNLYIRTMATDTTVASAIQTLIVDKRPYAPTFLTIDDNKNLISWTNNHYFPNFTDYEISVDSGKLWMDCTGNPYNIGNNAYPAGAIYIRTKATTNSFYGDAIVSKDPFTVITGIQDLQKLGIHIFPNPVQNQLTISGMPETALLTIFYQNGASAKQIMLNAGNNEVPLKDIPVGVYILKINSKNLNIEYKIVKN